VGPAGSPRDPCYYFFKEIFNRIDDGGSWTASYARADYIQRGGRETVDSADNPFTDFRSSVGGSSARGRFDITIPSTGDYDGTEIWILRSRSVIQEHPFGIRGGGHDLIDLRCMPVGHTGWLVQGFSVDPEDTFNTVRTYQWAISLSFVPGINLVVD